MKKYYARALFFVMVSTLLFGSGTANQISF
jgi:hypothetical protein